MKDLYEQIGETDFYGHKIPIYKSLMQSFIGCHGKVEITDRRDEMWQPIETVPKDGTTVSLWAIFTGQEGGQWWPEATWDGDGWQVDDNWGGGHLVPAWDITHWMPLPDPPTK